ncbi:MAG TPA: hypothetical protein VF590_26215 [Isosphaeraceae bacterium]
MPVSAVVDLGAALVGVAPLALMLRLLSNLVAGVAMMTAWTGDAAGDGASPGAFQPPG